jgi:hypothetical protein
VKNRRIKKKRAGTFFSWKTFFSVVQIPEHIGMKAMRGTIKKVWVKILVK